ncbi:unnamed protein product [Linum tenue]|nr:unnamed protein product [Linum tenue]
MKNGCFLVRFRNKLDYEGAAEGGPWLLGDTYLTVHRWYKGFNPWKATVQSTAVWVQLPDLPIEFFNAEAVTMIAELIGKPIRVDRATELGARGNYARVSVEVDLTKPLLAKYKVEGVEYLIQYEGLENICGECGLFGQTMTRCSCSNMGEETGKSGEEMPPTQSEPAASQAVGRVYGEWMSVKRKSSWNTKRGVSARRDIQVSHGGNKANSFAALAGDVEEEIQDEGRGKNSSEKESQASKIEKARENMTGRSSSPRTTQVGVKTGGNKSQSLKPMQNVPKAKEKAGGKVSLVGQGVKRGVNDEANRHASHAKGVSQSSGSRGAGIRSANDGTEATSTSKGQVLNEGAGNLSPSGDQ